MASMDTTKAEISPTDRIFFDDEIDALFYNWKTVAIMLILFGNIVKEYRIREEMSFAPPYFFYKSPLGIVYIIENHYVTGLNHFKQRPLI